MKKFFLFRKEEINASSVTASDSGQGLSVLALPADNLAFASAGRGFVVLSFNGATPYEESNLTDGESIEKTTVKVPCEIGSEVDLIESILAFISRQGGKSVMKFDAVDQSSTFSPVSFDSKIESRVHVNPTKRLTGESSTQTFLGSSGALGITVASTSIAGIDYGTSENQPTIDYNHEGLSSFASGDEITSWANAGTGGSAYNIASNVGDPSCVIAKAVAFSQKSAFIDTAEHFIVPEFSTSNDYTLYVVYLQRENEAHPLYSDADGQSFGFTIGQTVEDSSGNITKHKPTSIGNFTVRHDTMTGEPATARVLGTENGTVDYTYPDADADNYEHVLVFVIRRDENNNLYMYNRDGDIVSFIAARTDTFSSDIGTLKSTFATPGRTDGPLKIQRLGTVKDYTSFAFRGGLARFGVIEKDIGSASCSKLATDLFKFYKF